MHFELAVLQKKLLYIRYLLGPYTWIENKITILGYLASDFTDEINRVKCI